MEIDLLKVPKALRQVVFWIHPEGRVIGSIFLRKHSAYHAGGETPSEALNHPEPFIAFKREAPPELRFYNRKSIIRVEYEGKDDQAVTTLKPLPCQMYMMDGSFIKGCIHEPLHPNKARLLDYLNNSEDSFINIQVDKNTILVNKSYINYVYIDNLEDGDEI
ncbi:MAG: hypothetical protein GXP08_17565 [Gammaproteobacteria bacterium]|nr:hypothetical protein [Gammaproteobacteria bacterium]